MSVLPEFRKIIEAQLNKSFLSEWTVSDQSEVSSDRSEITCILENPKQQKAVSLQMPTAWFDERRMYDGIGALMRRAVLHPFRP
jgi:hypothetical protein